MNRVLRHKQSVKFDPENQTHLQIYADFLRTGKWNSEIQFMLEEPHEIIPVMIDKKLASVYLKSKGFQVDKVTKQ